MQRHIILDPPESGDNIIANVKVVKDPIGSSEIE
jgi:hypothetical protein